MQLVLEAIRGGSNMSDIAVDDIHVYYCAAKEHPLNDVTHADVLSKFKFGGQQYSRLLPDTSDFVRLANCANGRNSLNAEPVHSCQRVHQHCPFEEDNVCNSALPE